MALEWIENKKGAIFKFLTEDISSLLTSAFHQNSFDFTSLFWTDPGFSVGKFESRKFFLGEAALMETRFLIGFLLKVGGMHSL